LTVRSNSRRAGRWATDHPCRLPLHLLPQVPSWASLHRATASLRCRRFRRDTGDDRPSRSAEQGELGSMDECNDVGRSERDEQSGHSTTNLGDQSRGEDG
jgi:hypothetical protein